jgi:hypothetical protein
VREFRRLLDLFTRVGLRKALTAHERRGGKRGGRGERR